MGAAAVQSLQGGSSTPPTLEWDWKTYRSADGGNVLQRCRRWNGTDTLLLLDYNNNLQQFHCWNGTIRRQCLPAAPSPGRPAARGAPLFPPGKRGRRGPERENLVGFPPLDFSFPSWGVFNRKIHYSVDERKSGRNSDRSDDIKDVIAHELCSRGGCFFRFSHRLCDSGIGDGDPQRAASLRGLRNCDFRSIRMSRKKIIM